jgi:hypothetical protein
MESPVSDLAVGNVQVVGDEEVVSRGEVPPPDEAVSMVMRSLAAA